MKVTRGIIIKHPVRVARHNKPPFEVAELDYDQVRSILLTHFYTDVGKAQEVSRPNEVYFEIKHMVVHSNHTTSFSIDLHHPQELYRNRPEYMRFIAALLEKKLWNAFSK